MQNITSSSVTSTNIHISLVEHRSKGVELFTFVLSILTIAVGTVGNVLLCFTIATSASLRTPMNTFVLSIGFVDLLTSLLLLPLRVVVERKLLSKEEIKPVLYQVELFVRTFTDITRLFLMMSLSVERYQSIAKPLIVSKVQAKRRALIMSGLTWTISILLSIISIRYYCNTLFHDPCLDNTNNTMPNWGNLEAFVEMPLSLFSIATIAVSYGLIVMILRQQRAKMRGHTKTKVNQVTPASYEKRPESTVNNPTNMTILEPYNRMKSTNFEVKDNAKQETPTNIKSGVKVKNTVYTIGDDVSHNILMKVRSNVKKETMFKGGDESKFQIAVPITATTEVVNLLKPVSDVKQQDSLDNISNDICNIYGSKCSVNEGGLNNWNKGNINADTSGYSAMNVSVYQLDKAEQILPTNMDTNMGVDNSVSKKSSLDKTSSDIHRPDSSPTINNQITSENRNKEVNIPKSTIEGKEFNKPNSVIITNSPELLKENVSVNCKKLDTARSLDFINTVHTHHERVGSSPVSFLVFEPLAHSSSSKELFVYECSDHDNIYKDQLVNHIQTSTLTYDHIWTSPHFALTNENSDLATARLSQTSHDVDTSADSSILDPSWADVSKSVLLNPSDTVCDAKISTFLSQSKHLHLAASKTLNTHIRSTELTQTNKQVSHLHNYSNKNRSVRLGDSTENVSLQNKNFNQTELFNAQKVNYSESIENGIILNNYFHSASPKDSNVNSKSQIADVKITDSKTLPESVSLKRHQFSSKADFRYSHQDEQRNGHNCVDSLTTSCKQFPDDFRSTYLHSSEQPVFTEENLEIFHEQLGKLHLLTNEANTNSGQESKQNDCDATICTSQFSVVGTRDHQTLQSSKSIESSENNQLLDQYVCKSVSAKVISNNETAGNELINEPDRLINDTEKNEIVLIKNSANASINSEMGKEIAQLKSNNEMVNDLMMRVSKKDDIGLLTSNKEIIDELVLLTNNKETASELKQLTSNKITAYRLAYGTSNKETPGELLHVTSNKETADELAHVTSNKETPDELAHVTSNKDINEVNSLNTATNDKRVEVVDMDGTVRLEVVSASNAAPIEGAVCLMNPRNREQGKRKVELKAALKVGLLVCCFVCLWMPLPISVCIFRETISCSQTMKVDILAIFSALATSTAAVDPILYGLLNRQIRSALFAGALKFRRKVRNCRK